MGSAVSSSSEFSDSEAVETVNGSGAYADAGTVLENNPRAGFDDECGEACRRRLGRSEALRMVGFALSISDMLLKRAGDRGTGRI